MVSTSNPHSGFESCSVQFDYYWLIFLVAGFVLDPSKFKFWAMLVNKPTGRLLSVGVFNPDMFSSILGYFVSSYFSGVPVNYTAHCSWIS